MDNRLAAALLALPEVTGSEALGRLAAIVTAPAGASSAGRGHNPAISVNHFFLPRRIAERPGPA